MIKPKTNIIKTLVACIFAFIIGLSPNTYAEESTGTSDSDTIASDILVVSPTSQRMNIVAGESFRAKVHVSNPIDGSEILRWRVSVEPYSVINEEYDADLGTMTDHTQIVDWISFDKTEGEVARNSSEDIYFTITVPPDAPAGGQYCIIAVQNVPNEAKNMNNGISISDTIEIASVVYANVAGQTERTGEILDNYVPTFSFSSPYQMTATIQNTGNVHQDARFTIEARSLFSDEIIYSTTEEPETELIMPDSTRLAVHYWQDSPRLGIFKVSQTVTFLGKTSVSERYVFICPWWFLLLVIAVIAAIVVEIIFAVKKHKKKSTKKLAQKPTSPKNIKVN